MGGTPGNASRAGWLRVKRTYRVSVFGFVTASIVGYFVGRAVEDGAAGVSSTSGGLPATRDADVGEQLAALRHEVALSGTSSPSLTAIAERA